MQGAEIEGEGAYWSMWLSPNIESNAAVGHLWDTASNMNDSLRQFHLFFGSPGKVEVALFKRVRMMFEQDGEELSV